MIHTNNYEHGHRIMKSINSQFTEVTMQVISRSENGVLLGGAVYENWTGAGGSVLAHISGFAQNWINRDMLTRSDTTSRRREKECGAGDSDIACPTTSLCWLLRHVLSCSVREDHGRAEWNSGAGVEAAAQ